MADNVWNVLQDQAPAAHAVLLRLTLNTDVADDLLHDLLVKLAASKAFRHATDPAAYVRRSAINQAMDWRRRRKRHGAVTNADVELPDHGRGPTERAEALDDIERILDAAGELSELEREAFVLRYVQDESYERVGMLLGRTAHQARGLCHAAVRHVRESLTERRVEQ